MKKKMVSMVLTASMVAGILSGCGSSTTTDSSTTTTDTTTSTGTEAAGGCPLQGIAFASQ